MPRKLPPALFAGLCLMVGWIVLFTVAAEYSHILIYQNAKTLPAMPFDLQYGRHPNHIERSFEQAGLRTTDLVTSVNGRPLQGLGTLYSTVLAMHGGDPLTVSYIRNGEPQTLTAPLDLLIPSKGPHGISVMILGALLSFVFPILAAAMAVWVLLSRPADLGAWCVAGILQFTVQFFAAFTLYGPPLLDFYRLSGEFSMTYLSMSAFVFGLTFPERSALDRRSPWLKWAFVAVCSGFFLISAAEVLIQDHDIALFEYPWAVVLNWIDRVSFGLSIIAISSLCAGIFSSYFASRSADARRRLRVVLIGSQVGLWPIFIIVIIAILTGKDTNRVAPFPVFLTALCLFMLFPASLVYSIVVERAMDVSILLRQGTQYALARGTLWFVQAALGAGVAWTVVILVRKHEQSTTEKIVALVFLLLFFAVRFAGRKRAARWIDRRFFREQYSTEQVLSELSAEAGRFTEADPLLQTVCRRLHDTLHVNCIAVFLRQGNVFRLQMAEGVALPEAFLLPESSRSVVELETGNRPATVYFDRPDEWLIEASDAERAALREMNAEVLLPLPGRQQLMGVMALGPKRSESPYSRTDLNLLTSVGAQTGLAVENSRLISSLADEAASRAKLNREIEIAREVQERLFPQSFPAIAGVEIAAHCRPAQAVGGDYYDMIAMHGDHIVEAGHAPGEDIAAADEAAPAGCDRLGIAIGDVSGKGISAALLMASLRASLRSQTLAGAGGLAAKMVNVNTLLYDASDSNRYATFFFAELDCVSRVLHYVNGGHNAPAVLRRTGAGWQVFRLEEGGPVVGLIPGASYCQQSLPLLAGDIFLAFTDGISEAMNHDEDEWGEDRLIADAQQHAFLPTDKLLAHLFQAADKFAAGAPQHDDMTLVIVRIT